MSQENVEILRAALDAVRRRDGMAAMQLLASDVVWHPYSAGVGVDEIHGPKEVVEFVSAFLSVWERAEFETLEMIDAEDAVVVRSHWRLQGRASGAETEVEISGVYTVQGGKIIRYREYEFRRDALESVGLRE
jgi:uncharacterized protein